MAIKKLHYNISVSVDIQAQKKVKGTIFLNFIQAFILCYIASLLLHVFPSLNTAIGADMTVSKDMINFISLQS